MSEVQWLFGVYMHDIDIFRTIDYMNLISLAMRGILLNNTWVVIPVIIKQTRVEVTSNCPWEADLMSLFPLSNVLDFRFGYQTS